MSDPSSSLRLPSLPEVGERRLAVRVSKDALRHVRKGHPWIYDESVTSLSHDGAAGDLAVIFDDKRRFAAIGLYDPTSPMRIKVLHANSQATIDRAWWEQCLDTALAVRRPLVEDSLTTGYRVLNGENDGVPGLILDRYEDTFVIKLYSAAWFPHLRDMLEAVADRLRPEAIVLRLARRVAERDCFGLADGDVLLGSCHEPTTFEEGGLKLLAHPRTGQKTGSFLDQRDNRRRVGGRSEGARVLDVFSCTGGFSVAAAAGGAIEVTSVDISPQAIATAGDVMDLNRSRRAVAACRWEGITGDAFEVMRRLRNDGRRFDVVVVDPPSFAQRQSSVAAGLKAYGRLTTLALELLEQDGLLVQASCSSRITPDDFYRQIHASAQGAGATLTEVARTDHALDHPVSFPEGAYLKALFARVHRLDERRRS